MQNDLFQRTSLEVTWCWVGILMAKHQELVRDDVVRNGEHLSCYGGVVSSDNAGAKAQILGLKRHLHEGEAAVDPSVIGGDIRVLRRFLSIEADQDGGLCSVPTASAFIHSIQVITFQHKKAPGLTIDRRRCEAPCFKDRAQLLFSDLLCGEPSTRIAIFDDISQLHDLAPFLFAFSLFDLDSTEGGEEREHALSSVTQRLI